VHDRGGWPTDAPIDQREHEHLHAPITNGDEPAAAARAGAGGAARPRDWYKSLPYRSRAVSDPRGVLNEFGVELDDEVELRVLDSTADIRYLVIPRRPDGSEGMREDELAALVTRDSMIGVAQPAAPAAVPS
jgi:hypothetical protein